MRDHSGVACVFRHFDRFQSFSQRTNLVELDQDRVSDIFFDTFFQDLGVGYEQVVTHQLDFSAQFFSLIFPASPVRFILTVFDRNDWVLVTQFCQVVREFFSREDFAFAFQVVLAVFVEFRRRTVESQCDVLVQLVASVRHSFFDRCQCIGVRRQVWCETTFVANGSVQALRRQYFLQSVEDFCATTQSFSEGRRANWLYHEFLNINVVVCVLTTIDDVHHGYWHRVNARGAVDVCDVFVQLNAFCSRSGFGSSQ